MSFPGGNPKGYGATWVRNSAVAHFFQHAPSPTPSLEHARVLQGLRRLPHALGGLTALSLVGFLVGLSTGHLAPAALLAVFTLACHFPAVALGLTPALLLGAPRLPLMTLGDELLFLRLDQAAIAGMVCALAFDRKTGFRSPPAHTALLLALAALPLSIIAGTAQGTLQTPASAFLYLAQWLTWYALFVAAYSLAPRLGNRAIYAWTLPLIAFAAYGLAESLWPYYEVPGVRYRTFERGLFPGQANHAAGLLALATTTGLALATQARYRFLGIALALVATLALLPTLSRSGLMAWLAGVGMLALLYCPPLRWWTPPLAVVGLIALPTSAWYRFSAPGSSMYDRLVAWKSALSTVTDYPLLGLGAGARHRSYYDNYYLMTLAESGLIGLVLFLAFLLLLLRALHHARGPHNPLATGALAGCVAMAVHGLATGTFIVTLTGGPLFWLCGVVLAPHKETTECH